MDAFKEEKSWQNDLRDTSALALFIFFSSVIVTMLMFFVGKGIEVQEYFEKVSFFAYLLPISLVLIIVLKIPSTIAKFTKSAKPVMINVFINDPEEGVTFLTKYKYFRGGWMITWSILFFSLMGLIASTVKESLFIHFVPTIQYQVTKTADVWFHVEPAVSSETLLFGVSLVLFFILKYFFQTNNIHIAYFWIFAVPFVAFISGMLGYGLHTVYAYDETKRMATFVFFALGSLLVMIFGQLIIWWIWHFMNNLFFRLYELSKQGVLGDEMFLIVFGIIWGVTFAVVITKLLIDLRKKRSIRGT